MTEGQAKASASAASESTTPSPEEEGGGEGELLATTLSRDSEQWNKALGNGEDERGETNWWLLKRSLLKFATPGPRDRAENPIIGKGTEMLAIDADYSSLFSQYKQ